VSQIPAEVSLGRVEGAQELWLPTATSACIFSFSSNPNQLLLSCRFLRRSPPIPPPPQRSIGAYERAEELYAQLKLRIEADVARAAVGGNVQCFEAAVISRARAEKQREASLRAMKVVSHWLLVPGRAGLVWFCFVGGLGGFAGIRMQPWAQSQLRAIKPRAPTHPPRRTPTPPQFRVVDHPPAKMSQERMGEPSKSSDGREGI